jgi:hypothetical protein
MLTGSDFKAELGRTFGIAEACSRQIDVAAKLAGCSDRRSRPTQRLVAGGLTRRNSMCAGGRAMAVMLTRPGRAF